MEELIILKVCQYTKSKQKFVTIPKGCNIKSGDYISIKKVVLDNG